MTQEIGAGRAAARFRAGLPSELLYDGRTHPCAAHDLSRSGVLLVGELPRPEGPTAEVILRSPTGDLELRATVRVKRIEIDEVEQALRIGVEFGALAPEQLAELESLVARVVEDRAPAPLAALPAGASPQQIREALISVPLAHRVTLAGRALPPDRELLLHDPSPQVLDALARNPRLLNHEARKLLLRRDLLPGTLEVLGRDPRWAADEELRLFIITHVRAPFALVDRLVAKLTPAERERVLRRPGLNAGVRAKLMAQLPRRPGG
jgi:hypothetical protein